MKQKDIYLGTVFGWRVLGHDWLPTSKDIIDMILASLGSVGPELEQAIKFVCS